MNFRRSEEPLINRRQSSNEIKSIISCFSGDLETIFLRSGGNDIPLSQLSFDKYFDFVKNIKYRKDTPPVEKVGRPLWIMAQVNAGKGIDCKKKAVLIGAYLHLHGVPFRFIGSSCREDRQIHHIFPQADFGNGWINVDATYAHYHIGQNKKVTAKEIL